MSLYNRLASDMVAQLRAENRNGPIRNFSNLQAFLALNPSDTTVRGGIPRLGGKVDVRDLGIPGLEADGPLFLSSHPGEFNPHSPPGRLLSPFQAADLEPYTGPAYPALHLELSALWHSKVLGTALLSQQEADGVAKLLDSGNVVFAVPDLGRGKAWSLLAAEMRTIRQEYNRKNIASARQAIAESQAAVQRWNAIYDAVQAIADLPATIVTAAGDVTGKVGLAALRSPTILVLLAAAGIAVALLVKTRGTPAPTLGA